MRKVDPQTLNANWGDTAKQSPLGYVTTAQLSKILGVRLHLLNTWKLREILPMPETNNKRLRGNKNYYCIATIRSWLEGKTEDQVLQEWLAEQWKITGITSGQAEFLCKTLKQANSLESRI
jgi:hypothetical protein